MPIYIVRWANTASVIRAANEHHLIDLLDEVGDPGDALWEEYEGPLWFDLEPKFRETSADEFEIDAEEFDTNTGPAEVLQPQATSSDTSSQMYWTIFARLFPDLYTTLREVTGAELPNEQAKARIVEAFEREQWFADACDQRPRHTTPPEEMALYAAALRGEVTIKRDLEAERQEAAVALREDTEWHQAQYARLVARRQQALVDLGADVGAGDGGFDDGGFDDGGVDDGGFGDDDFDN